MRQITRDAINAFMAGSSFSRDNTQVVVDTTGESVHGAGVYLLLHGNLIAWRSLSPSCPLWVRDGGWQSRTTKERLNGLPGITVHQHKGQWYLNGEEWAGEWARVNTLQREAFGPFTYCSPGNLTELVAE